MTHNIQSSGILDKKFTCETDTIIAKNSLTSTNMYVKGSCTDICI